MMDECFLHVEQLYTMIVAGKPWTAEMSRLGIHDYYWNAEVFVCPNFGTHPFVDTTQQVLEHNWTRQGFSNPQGIKLRTSQLIINDYSSGYHVTNVARLPYSDSKHDVRTKTYKNMQKL